MGLWHSKPSYGVWSPPRDVPPTAQLQVDYVRRVPASYPPTPDFLQIKQDSRLVVAIRWAALGHNDRMRECVGGSDVDGRLYGGETLLSEAAYNGRTSTCRLLVLEMGANPDAVGTMGYTALQNAFRRGHLGTARCLVRELGADPTCFSALGSCIFRFSRTPDSDAFLVKELGVDANSSNEGVAKRVWQDFGLERLYALASAAWEVGMELDLPYYCWQDAVSPLAYTVPLAI